MVPTRTVQVPITGDLGDVPGARRAAATFLAAVAPALAADGALVVTELVTNAVLHGGVPAELRLAALADGVRVEVQDRGRSLPERTGVAGGSDPAAGDTGTGRGLTLVGALSRGWGVVPQADGKVVWAELGAVDPAAPAAAAPPLDADAVLAAWADDEGETLVTVVLGEVPTRLVLQAKAHVDNLARELTLAAAGSEEGAQHLPQHLAAKVEGVVNRFAAPRQAIKRLAGRAAERGDGITELTFAVPMAAADVGAEYLAALDQADRYARAARLLTLATLPTHRAFRRWYVEAVVAALRAHALGEPPPPVEPFRDRLFAEFDAVAGMQVQASRVARLQTVTAALAEVTTVEQATRVLLVEGVAAMGATGGSLFLVNDRGVVVPVAVGYPDDLVRRLAAEGPGDNLPATTAARTGRPVWIETREERNALFPELAGLEPETEAICAMPLLGGGQVVGALRFSFDQAHLFDQEEREFVEALAGQATLALQRSELVASERAARVRAEELAEAVAEAADRLAKLAQGASDDPGAPRRPLPSG